MVGCWQIWPTPRSPFNPWLNEPNQYCFCPSCVLYQKGARISVHYCMLWLCACDSTFVNHMFDTLRPGKMAAIFTMKYYRLRSSFRCISWKRSDKDGAVPDNNGNINPDISENTEAVYEDIEANEYEHLKSKPYFKRSERGGTDPADNENTYCVTAENTERVYTTLAENVYYENVKWKTLFQQDFAAILSPTISVDFSIYVIISFQWYYSFGMAIKSKLPPFR